MTIRANIASLFICIIFVPSICVASSTTIDYTYLDYGIGIVVFGWVIGAVVGAIFALFRRAI
jgi:hypothetical protein